MIELCPGKADTKMVEITRDQIKEGSDTWRDRRCSQGVRRILMTCKLCGRRIPSSIYVGHDGDIIVHEMPPHKPRGWWRKPPRVKRNTRYGKK